MNKPAQLELVGRKIRQLRRQRKLTQVELADRIGVHQSDLSRMEQGEYKVGLDTLLKILGTFELNSRIEALRQEALAKVRSEKFDEALDMYDQALGLTTDEEVCELITINKA